MKIYRFDDDDVDDNVEIREFNAQSNVTLALFINFRQYLRTTGV